MKKVAILVGVVAALPFSSAPLAAQRGVTEINEGTVRNVYINKPLVGARGYVVGDFAQGQVRVEVMDFPASETGYEVFMFQIDVGFLNNTVLISQFFRVSQDNLQGNKNSLAKDYRILFQNLKLTVSVPDPIRCIVKIANNLNISENTKREAMRIFDTLKEKKLIAGKKPNSVAATVIYMAGIKTGVNLSQHKISRVSGITVVTIRNRYKEYIKHVKLI